ncbi:MAG: DnaB-like helicase N-terminal domain-containing protein [Vicinamibacterales bacterium]|nr:DnaB-like helicase N-terminal domain-containing protein [Vicinamibacterales bacterium]
MSLGNVARIAEARDLEQSPHDLDTERAVLGALIVENGLLDAVRAVVSPEAFFRDAHRRICRAVYELGDSGIPIDPLTLIAIHRDRGELDAVGGPAYVTSLIDGLPRGMNATTHAARVAHHHHQRLALAGLEAAKRDLYAGELPDLSRLSALLSAATVGAGGGAGVLEIVTEHDLAARPQPTGVVRGVLPTGITCIAGAPAGGKTTTAASIAVAKASGHRWLRLYEVAERGPVIIMAGEAAENLPRLLKAARHAHGLGLEDVLPIWIIPQAFSLFTPGREYAELLAYARSIEPRPLFIWDTLGIYSAGAKENDNTEMQVVMSNLRAIHGDHLVLHHTDKGERDARGAGAIRANLDALFMLIDTDGRIVLSNAKQRAAAKAADIHLQLVADPAIGAAAVRTASSITRAPGELSANQRTVLDALWETFATTGAGVPQLEAALPHVKQRTLYDAVDKLVTHGFARRDGGRVYPVNR